MSIQKLGLKHGREEPRLLQTSTSCEVKGKNPKESTSQNLLFQIVSKLPGILPLGSFG